MKDAGVGDITLNASDPTTRVGGTCVIDLTFDVMKAPAIDGDPLTPGIQTYQLVNTAGWHTELNNTASCCGGGWYSLLCQPSTMWMSDLAMNAKTADSTSGIHDPVARS